jgi:Ca2+-transporting ATPase
MTLVFVALVLIEFFKAYNYRSDRHSFLRRPFANRWLNLAICWELLLLLVVLYLPFFQHAMDTFSMPLDDWVRVLAVALTIFPVLEAAKFLERRGWFGEME